MKINEIITEDDGGTMAGNIASVTAPLGGIIKRPGLETEKKSKKKKKIVSEVHDQMYDYTGTRPIYIPLDTGTSLNGAKMDGRYIEIPSSPNDVKNYKEYVRNNRTKIKNMIKDKVPGSKYFLPAMFMFNDYNKGKEVDLLKYKWDF
jgi:hypothetical protein